MITTSAFRFAFNPAILREQTRQYATAAAKPKSHPPRRTYLYNMYQSIIQNNRALFVFQHNNLTVQEFTRLRQDMSLVQSPSALTVLQTSIFLSVLRSTKYANLEPLISGPTCTLTMDAENPAAMKQILDLMTRNRKLMLLGGKVDNTLLNRDDVLKVVQLPALGDLRAELLGTLQAPARKLLSILESPASQVHSILDRRI